MLTHIFFLFFDIELLDHLTAIDCTFFMLQTFNFNSKIGKRRKTKFPGVNLNQRKSEQKIDLSTKIKTFH